VARVLNTADIFREEEEVGEEEEEEEVRSFSSKALVG
jgi:hypothetical protein